MPMRQYFNHSRFKEFGNKKIVLTDLSYFDTTHFLTLYNPCLGCDPYFSTYTFNLRHKGMEQYVSNISLEIDQALKYSISYCHG